MKMPKSEEGLISASQITVFIPRLRTRYNHIKCFTSGRFQLTEYLVKQENEACTPS